MEQQSRKAKQALVSPPITIDEQLPKVIYADRITGAGFGAGVSRLTLALETGPDTFVTSAVLVLPTPALLEAMSQVLNSVRGDPKIKQGIIESLDKFKEQLNISS